MDMVTSDVYDMSIVNQLQFFLTLPISSYDTKIEATELYQSLSLTV